MYAAGSIGRGRGHQRTPSTMRRGNALVLVAGALVLLVIIASAYLSSAQGIRKTTMAQRRSVNVDAAAGVVAEDIAKEISEALFVREIDPSPVVSQFGPTSIINRLMDIVTPPLGDGYSERFLEDRRLPLSSVNYFQEMGRSQGRYEVDRNFAWNFAPYEVSPRTNWPDYPQFQVPSWHGYDESTYAWSVAFSTATGLSNPPGQPGTSDTRWLRDLEPLRASTSAYLGSQMGLSHKTNQDTFSHYSHLTNLARPGNDWRICRDIADVTGAVSPSHNAMAMGEIWTGADDPLIPFDPAQAGPDGFHYFGGLLRDHHVPVEQWLSPSPTVNGALHRDVYSGTTFFTSPVDFWRRWQRWFDYAGYAYAQSKVYQYGNSNLVPPNFYDLSNLDGDTMLTGNGGGEVLADLNDLDLQGDAIGERPEDEFIRGSARWHVSRVLTDTDGDGFTDSFWFHVPGRGSEGTMQIVGVSVTDNAGRLNANTATRFVRSDSASGSRTRTRGWTPADLALVGQNAAWSPGAANSGWNHGDAGWGPSLHESWNVGFLDNPSNSPGLFDIEAAAGMPPNAYELIGHYRQGLDAIDKTVQEQNTTDERWRSEVFPIWQPRYYRDGEGDFLSETNVQSNSWFPESFDIHRGANRLFYFKNAGADPQNPKMSFTPFTFSDEIELRTNEGNNQPWLMTRFERAVGPSQDSGGYYAHPLRSFSHRQEHAELVDQLSARQLFFDNRRKLTLFSGSRNEQLPPWLWWEYRGSRQTAIDSNGEVINGTSVHGVPLSPPVDLGGVVGPPMNKLAPQQGMNQDWLDDQWHAVVPPRPDRPDYFGSVRNAPNTSLSAFYDQMRMKLDLREHERYIPYQPLLSGQTAYRPRTFSERLPYALFMALHSGDLSPVSSFGTMTSRNPFDNHTMSTDNISSKNLTRDMAASYAANILAWRDPDSDAPLYSQTVIRPGTAELHREYGAVRPPIFLDDLDVPNWSQNQAAAHYISQNNAAEPAFLGMEMQPFIMESFVAHIVEPWDPNVVKVIDGKRYEWDSGNNQARLFIEYKNGDEDDLDATGNNIIGFTQHERESRDILGDPSKGLPESESVVVVQIANPYDRPLPLFGKNPNTGLLSRQLPLYTVSFFGQSVVIDDNLVQLSEEGYDNSYTDQYTYNQGTEPSNLEPNQVPGRIPRLPLYLPPATPEAPYTLILFATGYGPGDVEDSRWIDFLDLNPEDHFYGTWGINDIIEPHLFSLARDQDGNGVLEQAEVKEPESDYGEPQDGLLRIYPGDLICRVPSGTWATDREHYDEADGTNSGSNGVAIQLLRTHRRDYDGDKDFTGTFEVAPGQVCHEYNINVVIDRTGAPSATGFGNNQQNPPMADEFFEMVTQTLECERLPNLAEFTHATDANKKMNGATEVGGFGTNPDKSFENQPLVENVINRLNQKPTDYPMLINHLESHVSAIGDNARAFQFQVTVPTDVHDPAWGVQSTIDSVRWCQWARYTRAWGVDPSYPGVEMATQPGQVAAVPLSTAFVSAPVNHMNRRAPRYVLSDAQVTRSKGRPLISGINAEPEILPKDTEGMSTFYEGMEQHLGDVVDRESNLLGSILVLNNDHRTDEDGLPDKTRYMFESNQVLTNSYDVKPAWGQVFDMASDPDGSFNIFLDQAPLWPDETAPDRHWVRSPWMTRHYRLPYSQGTLQQSQQWFFASRKPTFFNMNHDFYQGHPSFQNVWSAGTDGSHVYNFPDKGYYGYEGIMGQQELMPYGFQMLQKDGNFEQVGEVLNVMTWCHELLMPAGPPTATTQVTTTRTFSETLSNLARTGMPDDDDSSGGGGPVIGMLGGDDGKDSTMAARGPADAELVELFPNGTSRYLGRLSMNPMNPQTAPGFLGNAVGKIQAGPGWPHSSLWMSDLGHVEPDLTPAQRVVELFVCDGPGNWDIYHNLQNAYGYSDGVIDYPQMASSHIGYEPSFGNARDFSGDSTAGLVNINTATTEVLRTLPHMYKMVHGTPDWEEDDSASFTRGSILESDGTSSNTLFDSNPRVAIPEAIVSYRSLQGSADEFNPIIEDMVTGYSFGPNYFRQRTPKNDEFNEATSPRGGHGFSSIGELFNLNQDAREDFNAYRFATGYPGQYQSNYHDPSGHDIYLDAWTMDFAAKEPFTRDAYQRLRIKSGADSQAWYNQSLGYDRRAPNPSWSQFGQNWSKVNSAPTILSIGAPLSTDVNGEPQFQVDWGNLVFDDLETYRGGDKVAGDAEEANLLFSGISNMVTTRSDVFTVHFQIRTFVQNPETGLWDATDPDMILDDSRYVMLVDRSAVDRPDQSPRILYLQKTSN